MRPLAKHRCHSVWQDVTNDEQLDALFSDAQETMGQIDFLVHSVAYATRDDLLGRFVETSRAGYQLSQNVSAYSLIELARRARPLMAEGGSLLALT